MVDVRSKVFECIKIMDRYINASDNEQQVNAIKQYRDVFNDAWFSNTRTKANTMFLNAMCDFLMNYYRKHGLGKFSLSTAQYNTLSHIAQKPGRMK